MSKKHVDLGLLLASHETDRVCSLSSLPSQSSLWSLTASLVCLSQASNGNDPWSAWNADPSGGTSNNWASNPEGTQTGKSAADPWGNVSQGHPQAYQGPGKKQFVLTAAVYVRLSVMLELCFQRSFKMCLDASFVFFFFDFMY